MAQWVKNDIVGTAMSDVFLHRWYMSSAMEKCESDVATLHSGTNAMQFVAKNAITNYVLNCSNNNNINNNNEIDSDKKL